MSMTLIPVAQLGGQKPCQLAANRRKVPLKHRTPVNAKIRHVHGYGHEGDAAEQYTLDETKQPAKDMIRPGKHRQLKNPPKHPRDNAHSHQSPYENKPIGRGRYVQGVFDETRQIGLGRSPVLIGGIKTDGQAGDGGQLHYQAAEEAAH